MIGLYLSLISFIFNIFFSQDILENDEMKLDWMFKLSFISDIANVSKTIIIFLHS